MGKTRWCTVATEDQTNVGRNILCADLDRPPVSVNQRPQGSGYENSNDDYVLDDLGRAAGEENIELGEA